MSVEGHGDSPVENQDVKLIQLTVIDLVNEEIAYVMTTQQPMRTLMIKHAQTVGILAENLIMSFNGTEIKPDETIDSLGISSFDRILAYDKKTLRITTGGLSSGFSRYASRDSHTETET